MVIQWAIIHIHTHTHIYIYITHMSSHVIQWGYFIYLIQLFLFSPIYQVDCTPDGVSGSYAQMDFLRERSAWFSLIPRISWREDMRVFFFGYLILQLTCRFPKQIHCTYDLWIFMILLVKCICLLVIQRVQLVPPSPPARSWFIDSTTYRYLQIIRFTIN